MFPKLLPCFLYLWTASWKTFGGSSENLMSVCVPWSTKFTLIYLLILSTHIQARDLHACLPLCLSLFLLLRYESSTLILYKELSSSIFQSLSVCESMWRIGNTWQGLHFFNIKASIPSTDPVTSITASCWLSTAKYQALLSYTDPVDSSIT